MPVDALPGPDAYIRTDGGPFGLIVRPTGQTCKAPADIENPPMKLSQTGCVDPMDPTKPAASLIPYDVNSPLWSDGAAKQRFMALPDGQLIHVKDCTRDPASCASVKGSGSNPDEGHWEFPVGTVLVKSFLFRNKFLETRLFIHLPTKWAGITYEWSDDQKDATLLDFFGKDKMVMNDAGTMQTWSFPGRNDCNDCHNKSVGFSLGLETAQLNKDLQYSPGNTANQIATLEHIGMFDAPVPIKPALLNPGADTQAATLTSRARSYMQANCAICHRPEGEYPDIDLRFDTALKDTAICNVAPNKGELVAGSKRLTPANPMKSVMVLRMLAKDRMAGRMPQLATSVIDTVGVKVISDWITSVKTCP
jgi:uncharacterized repeat protein (TIGR03806 family)